MRHKFIKVRGDSIKICTLRDFLRLVPRALYNDPIVAFSVQNHLSSALFIGSQTSVDLNTFEPHYDVKHVKLKSLSVINWIDVFIAEHAIETIDLDAGRPISSILDSAIGMLRNYSNIDCMRLVRVKPRTWILCVDTDYAVPIFHPINHEAQASITCLRTDMNIFTLKRGSRAVRY